MYFMTCLYHHVSLSGIQMHYALKLHQTWNCIHDYCHLTPEFLAPIWQQNSVHFMLVLLNSKVSISVTWKDWIYHYSFWTFIQPLNVTIAKTKFVFIKFWPPFLINVINFIVLLFLVHTSVTPRSCKRSDTLFQKSLHLFLTWREYFFSQPTHFSSQPKK